MTGKQPDDAVNRIPTGAGLTALDPAFRTDPYRAFARLRERQPVHYDDVIKRWVLTRQDDIENLLRDRTMSVDPLKAIPGTYMWIFERFHDFSMLFQDPPNHTRLRSLVSKAFTPRAIERLAPRIVEIIDELLAAVATEDRFDVIETIAVPLPMIVIAEMLGIDPTHRRDFKRWSEWQAMSLNPLLTAAEQTQCAEAGAELEVYLQRAIAERRATRERI